MVGRGVRFALEVSECLERAEHVLLIRSSASRINDLRGSNRRLNSTPSPAQVPVLTEQSYNELIGYEPRGRGFDSCRPHHYFDYFAIRIAKRLTEKKSHYAFNSCKRERTI